MSQRRAGKATPINIEQEMPRPEPAIARALGSRILALLFLVRSSGNHIYKQELGLTDIELRLIGVIGRLDPMTSLQLANIIGCSKPQISRATTRLLGQGLIVRAHRRAPFALTEHGAREFKRMSAIAADRHQRIMAGLDAEALHFLSAMVSKLMRVGEEWLAEEQRLAAPEAAGNIEPFISGASGDVAAWDSLIPSLVTMSVLMQRSAFLLWRRTVGISHFNWIVLSRVAEAKRLRFYSLVYYTARDKAQVWRSVTRLIEDGLLVRHQERGRREVELSVTAEGQRIYQITAEHTIQRDALINATLGQNNKTRFIALVEIMIENVQLLMPRTTEV